MSPAGTDLPSELAQVIAEWPTSPSALRTARVSRLIRQLPKVGNERTPLRLGIVSSFTFSFMSDPLLVRAFCEGFHLAMYASPYGQYAQDLINPRSRLHEYAPDMVLIAVRWQDVLPQLSENFNSLSSLQVRALVDDWKERFSSMLNAFRDHSDAHVLCTNYEQPAYPSLGMADGVAAHSQRRVVNELNEWLYQRSAELGRASIVDVDSTAARCGRENWIDPRLALLTRSPIAAAHHWDYAGEVLRVIRAVTGKVRKVLALDCDNTLWGGVLGDVGRDGLALGHDFPGNAYRAFQLRALELQRRGVVLAIASKNDKSAVLDVFENHPQMVLRPEHISYFAVDWSPKANNLRHAAGVLNLGLDSFVFLDDNAVECDMMRQLAPEVLTVQLPNDVARFEPTLARLTCFDQLTVSDEDRTRGTMYRQEAQRAELKEQVADIESFYASLGMIMRVSMNDGSQAARAAQLTQRTNQFNMTTIRRTEEEIRLLMASDVFRVYTMGLEDRFGDNGTVGLAIVECQEDVWKIDSFLVSCRVLGRTVEDSFLRWIARQARTAGARRLIALYVPTKKNESFSDFYQNCGMQQDATATDPPRSWFYDLRDDSLKLNLPEWIHTESPGK